jgi:hypothetical protein
MQLEGVGKLEGGRGDLTGKRTHDLLGYNIVPQPIMQPHTFS